MKITNETLFTTFLTRLGLNVQVKKVGKNFKGGVYTYNTSKKIISKLTKQSVFVGGGYDIVKKLLTYEIVSLHGEVRIVDMNSKKDIAIFKHKTEPLYVA